MLDAFGVGEGDKTGAHVLHRLTIAEEKQQRVPCATGDEAVERFCVTVNDEVMEEAGSPQFEELCSSQNGKAGFISPRPAS